MRKTTEEHHAAIRRALQPVAEDLDRLQAGSFAALTAAIDAALADGVVASSLPLPQLRMVGALTRDSAGLAVIVDSLSRLHATGWIQETR